MKDVFSIAQNEGETQKTSKDVLRRKYSYEILAKKRLTTKGLLHTYSMTLQKCIAG